MHFYQNMQAMAKMGYVKQLDHKECARILYEQVGEKFLQDEDMEKRYEFFIKILRANSEKKEEINELLAETFLDITLEDIPEHSSDKLYDYFIAQQIDKRALRLEHEFAQVISLQERFGFPFNSKAAYALVNELKARRSELEENLQKTFPPFSL